MKIALLGDTHFGARNDSQVFHNFFEKFYAKCFFPYLKENGIDTIIQLGDLFDSPKSINKYSLARCKEYFFSKVQENNLKLLVNVGNHDIYYKNSNEINSPDLFLKEFVNIEVISHPIEKVIGDVNFLFLPWICKDNYDDSMKMIDTSSSQYVIGHLELQGFAMYKGLPSKQGMSSTIFDKFRYVFTGHYHHKSSNGSIHYLGTPYEITWSDADDPRGFHIFDTETEELTFIRNPYTIFKSHTYNDCVSTLEEIDEYDFSAFKDKYIKLSSDVVSSYVCFDSFSKKVEEYSYDLKIINSSNIESLESFEDDVDIEDTFTIIKGMTESAETIVDKESLLAVMTTLYSESIALERI